MNKTIKNIFLFTMILTIASNLAHTQTSVDGEYYSSSLKEGDILRWEIVCFDILADETIGNPNNLTLRILQDIPEDESIHFLNFQNYFNITYNLLNYTSWVILIEYIYPVLYVQNGTSMTIHEFYVDKYGDSEYYNIEHKSGDTILTGTLTREDYELVSTTIIDDETGIVRKRVQQSTYFDNDEITGQYKFETTYIGDLKLTFLDSSTIFLAISLVTIFILRKRRKQNQPPLS